MVQINVLLNTIKVIISSSDVEQYYLGLSSDPVDVHPKVLSQGFNGYVLIDFRLEDKLAIDRNRELFELCTSDSSSILYKKYHHEKRDKRFFPSLGGKKIGESDELYDIFLCWWNKKTK